MQQLQITSNWQSDIKLGHNHFYIKGAELEDF